MSERDPAQPSADRSRSPHDPEPPHDILAAEEFAVGTGDPALHVEPPHDVLAAEEFELGTGDPALHVEPPHDVLAAEEFELGTADPALHRAPFSVPDKPGAEPRPHDVLAADEFAVPAGPQPAAEERTVVVGLGRRGLLALGGAAAVILAVLRRRR